MLNVRSHSSLLLVTMLPPPLIPALLNNKWILPVWWRSATSSRNRSTCVRSATSAMCVDAQPLRQSRGLAQPLRFRQTCRRDVAHRDVAGFRHQLADQLAAHSAAAAGDYRGPPSEFGHVYLPCVLAPIHMRPPQLPLRRWGRAVWGAMSGRQAPTDLPRELLEEIDIISEQF